MYHRINLNAPRGRDSTAKCRRPAPGKGDIRAPAGTKYDQPRPADPLETGAPTRQQERLGPYTPTVGTPAAATSWRIVLWVRLPACPTLHGKPDLVGTQNAFALPPAGGTRARALCETAATENWLFGSEAASRPRAHRPGFDQRLVSPECLADFCRRTFVDALGGGKLGVCGNSQPWIPCTASTASSKWPFVSCSIRCCRGIRNPRAGHGVKRWS